MCEHKLYPKYPLHHLQPGDYMHVVVQRTSQKVCVLTVTMNCMQTCTRMMHSTLPLLLFDSSSTGEEIDVFTVVCTVSIPRHASCLRVWSFRAIGTAALVHAQKKKN